jgi:hypothetical protein
LEAVLARLKLCRAPTTALMQLDRERALAVVDDLSKTPDWNVYASAFRNVDSDQLQKAFTRLKAAEFDASLKLALGQDAEHVWTEDQFRRPGRVSGRLSAAHADVTSRRSGSGCCQAV